MFSEEEIQDAIAKVKDGNEEAVGHARLALQEAVLWASPRVLALMLVAFNEIGNVLVEEDGAAREYRNN